MRFNLIGLLPSFLHPDRDHRHIVGLLRFAREPVRRFYQPIHHLMSGQPAAVPHNLLYFRLVPHFVLSVGRLADAIGKAQNRIARMEHNLALIVCGKIQQTHRKPAAVQTLYLASPTAKAWAEPGPH